MLYDALTIKRLILEHKNMKTFKEYLINSKRKWWLRKRKIGSGLEMTHFLLILACC